MLTEAKIAKLKPAKVRREYLDSDGLRYVIQPSGAMSWCVRYRFKGKPDKFTLEKVGGKVVGLREARNQAKVIRGLVASGVDPKADKRARQAPEPVAEPNKDSVNARLDQFVGRYIAGKQSERTAKESIALLRLYVRPVWGDRNLTEIKRSDVHDLLDSITDRDAPISANRTLALLKTAWRWFLERGYTDASPVHAIRKPHDEKPRERILTDDELVKLWLAVEKLGWPFQHIVQLLILTGCRREEVGQSCRSEFNLDEKLWRIPGERRKRNIPLTVPLSAMAIDILKGLPRFSGDLLFPASRNGSNRAFSGYSKSKFRLDEKSGVYNWTLHDLRRTTATGLGNLGVRSEIIEAVLGHRRRGIEKTYQLHPLLAERTTALNLWSHHLASLLDPAPESNVVQLHG